MQAKVKAVFIFVFFVALALPSESLSKPVPVIKDGSSSYKIVVSESSSEVLTFAASQLQSYLNQMSGVKIPIVEKKSQGEAFIFIGTFLNYGWLLPERINKNENHDQYAIVRKGNSLYIIGNRERGALYAVYHFLEMYGCRWFLPRFDFKYNLGEQVPIKRTIEIPDGDIFETAAFSYRCGLIVPGFWRATLDNSINLKRIIDWMAKLRFNIVGIHIKQYDNLPADVIKEIELRGLEISAEGHSWEYFLSQKSSVKQISGLNSKRDQNLLIDEIRYFTERNGEIDYLGPWGKDQSQWCINKKCAGSPADRAVQFYLNLEPRIKILNSDIRLIMIAYQDFLFPSKNLLQPDSTYIYICPIDKDHGKTLWDNQSKKNQKYTKAIGKWLAKGYQNNLIFYSYYRKHAWHSLPVNFPTLMAKEMSWCLKNGFIGTSNYLIDQDWLAYDIQHYAYAKLSWNPEISIESVLEDLFKSYFQSNWKGVYDFQLTFEEIIIGIIGDGYFGLNLRGLAGQRANKIHDAIKQLNGLFIKIEEIEKSTENEDLKKLLGYRRLWLQYWILKLQYASFYKTHKSLNQNQIDNLKNFFDGLQDQGLIHKGLVTHNLRQFRISRF